METNLKTFIDYYESAIIPLTKEMNLAMWQSYISGKEEDFKLAEELKKKYIEFHSNPNDFKKLKEFKASNLIKDPILTRELDILFKNYLINQSDASLLKEIVEMETAIEKKYNNYRAEINGKKLTDNEIEDILLKTADNKELQEVWEAHKKIGTIVADDIISLVKKRNLLAVKLGFKNYHKMSLFFNEQNPDEIEDIFNELDSMTGESFIIIKNDIDKYLSIKNKININKLMPWHYQNRFFQEAPKIYDVDLDKYYINKDINKLTVDYYSSINLHINDIIPGSDLYEKPGKSQHAFCFDIDCSGDIRVLCNIKPNSYWMGTMLHEFGHAVYNKYINRDLPFVLRQPAHIFTTEAIAMLFGRMSSNPQWIMEMTGITETERDKIKNDCYKILCLEQLVFSRWSQVMYRFEKNMYEKPDQDLNLLWWSLVEKYQMIRKPLDRDMPDWASKIHIALSPCYYHNYLLGQLLASQLNNYICSHILKNMSVLNTASYYNKPEVGEYLIDKVFDPGMKYSWNDMIKNATGEKLTAKYYAEQFV